MSRCRNRVFYNYVARTTAIDVLASGRITEGGLYRDLTTFITGDFCNDRILFSLVQGGDKKGIYRYAKEIGDYNGD